MAKIIISLSSNYLTKLSSGGIDPKVKDALAKLDVASRSFKDPSALAYAGVMRTAYDIYGIAGVKCQVMYLLNNAREWRGDEARECKKILNKWTKSK